MVGWLYSSCMIYEDLLSIASYEEILLHHVKHEEIGLHVTAISHQIAS